MPRDARAFWVVEPGRGEIRRETLAEPAEGDVLVETRYSRASFDRRLCELYEFLIGPAVLPEGAELVAENP